MKIRIQPVDYFKGFKICQDVDLEEFLSLITGKNGAGKTRFLDSIATGSTLIKINDEPLPPNEISLISISNETSRVLNPSSEHNKVQNLAEQIMGLITSHDKEVEFDEVYMFNFNSGGRMHIGEEYPLKDIIFRAEMLFKKNYTEITIHELELSLYVHKEIINNKNSHSMASLSELTVNYYKAIEKNIYNDFLKNRGNDICELDTDTLHNLIGDVSPHIPFNDIVQEMFRGKFSVTPPDARMRHISYHPKLILNSTGEIIEVNDLSSGEKTIFWLAEKTFHAYFTKAKNIFNQKNFILIDEPDCHLHPQMVKDFYECLTTLHEHLGVNFIISTHSPTTVALCPNESIFNLNYNNSSNIYEMSKITKDGAINQLLEGITQISVNPENCRQVYVENGNDSFIYQKIYTYIKNKSTLIDPNINLSFISAGPKIANTELSKHINSVFGESAKTNTLVEKINGDGNCNQVIGMVDYLCSNGNRTVRGLIDWDNVDRQHRDEVKVFAKGYAYSIENIIYDPISIYCFLTANDLYQSNYFFECTPDYNWKECLDDKEKLQIIIDKVTLDLINRENNKDYEIHYMNGLKLLGDKEYFIPKRGKNGHDFENDIFGFYKPLSTLRGNNKSRSLIYNFATKATLSLLGWGFVHKVVEQAFADLQK